MQETEMVKLSAPRLRLEEAKYFYSQFVAHCGPPRDSYFLMVAYFDAFLFALVSVEDMVPISVKAQLKSNEVFRFVKALRNITMHHSVLAALQPGAKFVRPFSRHVTEVIGSDPWASAKLAIDYPNFRAIFDAIEAERPSEKPTLDIARAYLAKLEAGLQPVFIESVLTNGLNAVAANVA